MMICSVADQICRFVTDKTVSAVIGCSNLQRGLCGTTQAANKSHPVVARDVPEKEAEDITAWTDSKVVEGQTLPDALPQAVASSSIVER